MAYIYIIILLSNDAKKMCTFSLKKIFLNWQKKLTFLKFCPSKKYLKQ